MNPLGKEKVWSGANNIKFSSHDFVEFLPYGTQSSIRPSAQVSAPASPTSWMSQMCTVTTQWAV